MTRLSIRHVNKRFGGLQALADVTFDVATGELVGLIGPNGSGKTTLLNILSGHQQADGGDVLLDGAHVQGLGPARLAQRGLSRLFQLTRVFQRMNVVDNLLVAGCALGVGRDEARRRAERLLGDLSLTQAAHLEAGHLSGGQMKLLEFGSCFMVQPRVALLDEPFAAVHPAMKEIMAGFIRARHAEGQTFILVSHDMPVILELCPRAVCMNAGAVIADGATREVLTNPRVIEVYLGGAA